MMTPTHPHTSSTTLVERLPLRLRLQPIELGQVQRAVFSRPDWDTAPHRVRVSRGLIKVGSYPRDDTHQVWLSMRPTGLTAPPRSATAGGQPFAPSERS
jgi:hypothetical protein